ncbi:MAG: hypothetical protein CM15mV95_090 [Caudoviricetes sp.]|nr:MAG: hypothetical protein CM15mV95_090 [Caudoviricetes sp.]
MFAKNGSVTDFRGDYAQAQSASADPTQTLLQHLIYLLVIMLMFVFIITTEHLLLYNQHMQDFGYRIIGA